MLPSFAKFFSFTSGLQSFTMLYIVLATKLNMEPEFNGVTDKPENM